MNEEDLKRAFQEVVVASSPPPSMDPGIALDRAHKARSNRRASVTGAVVAVLVVGVGLGTAFALNPQGTKDYMTGAGPSSSSSSAGTQWGDQWPLGQSDRTATNGPQADRGKLLLELAKDSVPAGYEAADLQFKEQGMSMGMLRAQAQISSNKGDSPEIWEYTAYVPVRKGEGVGELTVTVTTPNPNAPADPCALFTRQQDGQTPSCKMYEVEGKQVGVVSPVTPGQPAETWAAYRAANGWTVVVKQAEDYRYSGHPKLDRQPFFAPELAAVAADPKFLLGG
ncbi:hypothetical protein ACFWNN_12305 [Lentzea sp. NPDC058450]|uniref:hypothetical protein n=1 Tax=Lentzea sp. NPDC058450 TaxID=3346505 RepID=UPI0036590B84